MALRKKPAERAAITPLKRGAAQMSGSSESTATPTPMGSVTSERPRAIRPYRSPSLEDAPEEPEVVGPSSNAQDPQKEQRTVFGWKLATRCVVPELAGRLRAGFRDCCLKCSHTYYNYPDQMCWTPSGLGKCGDCLQGNHRCLPIDAQFHPKLEALQLTADAVLDSRADDEDAGLDEDSPTTLNFLADLLVAQRELTTAVKGKELATPKTKGASRTKGKGAVAPSSVVDPAIPLAEMGGPIVRDVGDPRQALLHHVEALAELDRVRTKGLKDAAKVFHASVEEVLGAYQAGLDSHVDTLKFLLG
ncbi:hypothetical protein VE00_11192 [Pseudogymnoascus sp. WSF 3629]|nr:hypothetical protein VE00_11192 [Pseudogymnoascus sp. WSF 3629]